MTYIQVRRPYIASVLAAVLIIRRDHLSKIVLGSAASGVDRCDQGRQGEVGVDRPVVGLPGAILYLLHKHDVGRFEKVGDLVSHLRHGRRGGSEVIDLNTGVSESLENRNAPLSLTL